MTRPIFISFSSKDLRTAEKVLEALENRGLGCWISSRDIGPGENFQSSIFNAIKQASVMLLVFTGNANNSDEIKKELALAGQHHLTVIPVRAEDVVPTEAFAYEFSTRQWIDLFGDWERSIQRLAEQISKITGVASKAAAPVAEMAVMEAESREKGATPPPVAGRPKPAAQVTDHVSADFYDAGPIAQIAVNLFYGWGYNFYRVENQLRTDDQLVREKVSWLLGQSRTAVSAAEIRYRQEFLPPPSRQNPYPSPTAVAGAKTLEQLSMDIMAIESQVRSQPVPENDRMIQRYRKEASTLSRLVDCDQRLVGQSELLRSILEAKEGTWIIEHIAEARQGLAAIKATLGERQQVLLVTP